MSEEIIVRRLHVSGLTPAITTTDLSQKLGSFGTIKALDGFGMVDALGEPRKFGYVTIETTKAKLARCMNLLSGVTWKGASLRLGEAKPDFRERLAKEREAMLKEANEPPRKKRRLPRGVHGVHAMEMSLVTPENVEERGGWKVTPAGRIVRPIRMRPEHPLPEPLATVPKPQTKKPKTVKEKKKKRVKEPPTRARRRTIDPTKWDSTHLKGIFLENAAPILRGDDTSISLPHHPPSDVVEESTSSSSESESEDEEERMDADVKDVHQSPVPSSPLAQTVPHPPPPQPKIDSRPKAAGDAVSDNLIDEKNAALGLLQSLFGDGGDDWAGQEIDSDIEMDVQTESIRPLPQSFQGADDPIEEVPLEYETITLLKSHSDDAQPPSTPNSSVAPVPAQPAKLKDLFAPREENGGFSLLGHLDLDLELDEDPLDLGISSNVPEVTPAPVSAPATQESRNAQSHIVLDATLPFFFPLSEEARAGMKGRVKDTFDVAREKGWDWRGFCRTQTSDEIKHRWEEQKVELTRDWKRRHREAIKSRRRRGGADVE